jgi:putative FmdB family regulatory protein
MPLYEYQCSSCETSKEVLQKNSDPAPECEVHGAMTRQISRTAIRPNGVRSGNNAATLERPYKPLPGR